MSRREAILKAALAALDAGEPTTIEEIGRRSGASVGSIYHHFGGVDGIAAALYIEILRDYQEGVGRALRRAEDAKDGIKALVRHHLRWVERNPERARFLLQGGAPRASADEQLQALNLRLSAAIGEWIDDQTEIRPVPREVFYATLIGPAQELSRAWLGGRIPSLRQLEGELSEATWQALRA